jgi:LysR family transcriptional regulator, hca operon transcriptional activator
MRRESFASELTFAVVINEPLVAVLPGEHRLASRQAIDLSDLVDETFIGVSMTAPTVQAVINDYLDRSGLGIKPVHEVDHLGMAMSLVASMGGVAFLPAYARNFLPSSVISRPIKGDGPTIDLVVGYDKKNTSPILRLFLSRLDQLIARVSKKFGELSG